MNWPLFMLVYEVVDGRPRAIVHAEVDAIHFDIGANPDLPNNSKYSVDAHGVPIPDTVRFGPEVQLALEVGA